MGAQMGLLAALAALLCVCAPARGASGCSGFKHLENGRTFFRYSGLLVVFRCHPGYKLHGYMTNSCVSGHWSRNPPVCVGSGCSSPGPLTHGTSGVNEDGSWAVFSCNSGFQLLGPSMLYCKGHTWNGTTPVCKESDMMSSVSSVTEQKSNVNQNLEDAVVLKTEQQSHHGVPAHTPPQTSSNNRIKVTDPKLPLQQQIPFPSFKVEDGAHGTQGSETGAGDRGSEAKDSEVGSVKSDPSASSPFTSSEQTTSSPPLFSTAHTTAVTAFTKQSRDSVTVLHVSLFAAVIGSSQPAAEEQAVTGLHRSPLSQPGSVDTEEPTEIVTSTLTPSGHSISAISSTILFPASLALSSQPPRGGSQQHDVTINSNSKPPVLSLTVRRPVCPHPPVPTHGTFYFLNVENPGPNVHGLYIQYACNPGYILAHGDMRSYCHEEGTWSGVTPVCLDVDECVEGQRQCQRCINTFGSFKCGCDRGYQPAHGHSSCQDVDECLLPAAVTGCVFGCVNTPGSFYCQCPTGYSLQTADSHCQDMDECAANLGRGPCMEECHNSPGSYRCSCAYGYILSGDGHSCIAECPPGYRKQPATPQNSTAQTVKEECADINECQEDTCEWQCVNLPGSHRCICPRGYTLQTDGQRCKDINECSRRNGGCSHLCLNQKGGYKCACPPSHRLSPYSWKKCVLRMTANGAG